MPIPGRWPARSGSGDGGVEAAFERAPMSVAVQEPAGLGPVRTSTHRTFAPLSAPRPAETFNAK